MVIMIVIIQNTFFYWHETYYNAFRQICTLQASGYIFQHIYGNYQKATTYDAHARKGPCAIYGNAGPNQPAHLRRPTRALVVRLHNH